MRYKDIQDLTTHSENKRNRKNGQIISYDQYREKLFELHNKEPKINMFGATFTI
ncbi:hypothetical protein [Butyrivibrio sp. AD3002]|uniref:hypothetical protein n=1 Tax=Butyrivibrio sp. AD3002 TaxID=1280670 RepID=UPI0003B53420|nr:hypothetical protein [Butyrivibrio sp. AD3002]